MAALRAERTLVKSTPELWAQLSDVECLGRHLGEFGEIRITRAEPETRVAWEGEHARGTVELEPSGWGTRVRVTAEVEAPEARTEEVPEPPTPSDEPAPVPLPDRGPEPEPEPPPAAAQEPVVDDPPSQDEPTRRGFMARFREYFRAPLPGAPDGHDPIAALLPDVLAASAPEPEPEPPAPEPEPVEPEPVEPVLHGPDPAPEPEPAPVPAADPLELLNGVLDSLGAAHHRPFSRG